MEKKRRDWAVVGMVLVFVLMAGVGSAATDVLFLVDTTGSMSGIDNIKTAFDGILEAIDANSPCSENVMYGVADYRNYVDGGDYALYGMTLEQPFTYSTQSVWSAIDGLGTGDGGDPPESQLKAMVTIAENWYTGTGDLGFNGREDAQKIIIWSGDAPGHISGDESGSMPEDYYPTLDETIDALTAEGIIVFALNSSGCDSGLNQLYAGHRQASEITAATGGVHFCSVGSGSPDINDAIVGAINCYSFIKDDDLDDANDLDCLSLEQELIYSVCLTNDSGQTIENAAIIDWLPEGADFVSAEPNGFYDPNTRSYLWLLDPIAPDATVCVYLTVVVNSAAEPGMYLHNEAELIVGEEVVSKATKDTLVCCYDTSGILYVDKNAPDGGNGSSWETSYNDLQDALHRAGTTQCSFDYVIYVTQGVYDPNETPDNSFALPDGVSVYGGFPSGGSDFEYRDPKRYETILTGLIDPQTLASTVVTMSDDTLLDGVTVTQALENAVYGNGVDFTVENCIISESFRYGLYAEGGNVTVKWCKVQLNDSDGILHDGVGYTLTVENSWLLRNGEAGVATDESVPTMKNTIVSESDLSGYDRAGIRMVNPASKPKLHNLTISNNRAEGIYYQNDADPNYLSKSDYLDIRSCIVYHNNGSGPQTRGLDPDKVAHYSCIADCNELPTTTNYNDEPGFAYVADPNGAPDPNNYHLAADSFCKDKGDPGFNDLTLPDYDGETRIANERVDVGADEVDCGDVHNELDWDADGLVNLKEFSRFQRAWLSYDPNHPLCDPNHPDFVSDPNAPGYISEQDKLRFNEQCDLVTDLTIDLLDIEAFVSDTPWLWVACWKAEQMAEAMAMSGGGESMAMMEAMSFETDSFEPVEEIDPYADMTTLEVVSLVTGIHEIIDHIEIAIKEDRKNSKNLTEAKDFLEEVLADIEAARQ